MLHRILTTIPEKDKETKKILVEGVKLLCTQYLQKKRRLKRRAIGRLTRMAKGRAQTHYHPSHAVRAGSRRGKKTRYRERRTVDQIYNALGPVYFKRAYRMSYASFLKLHESLLPYLIKATGYKDCSRSFDVMNVI